MKSPSKTFIAGLLLSLLLSSPVWARGGFAGFAGGGFGGRGFYGGGGFHGVPAYRGPMPGFNPAWGGWHGGGGWYRGGYPYGWNRPYYAYPSFGFFYGAYPYWPMYNGFWPYYGGFSYNTTVYVTPPKPPVYIEQSTSPKVEPLAPGIWQYCTDPEGYYPYVKECPGGWEELSSEPAGLEAGYWYYCDNPAGYYPYVRNCSVNWRKIVP